MGNEKWNEEKLEDTLRNMPKTEDRRSKEEILQRLKNDDRVQNDRIKPASKRKPPKWIPVLVAIAAVFLISILAPALFKTDQQASMDRAATESEKNAPDMEESQESAGDMSNLDIATFSRGVPADDHFAVYPADIKDQTAFHIGLATDQAAIAPVTFLIPDWQIEEDFETDQPDALALYQRYADQLDEEALGFTEYHPYKAEISSDGKDILMKFDEDQAYDTSSATLEMLNQSVQDTFHGYDAVRFLQHDGNPMVFDQVGEAVRPVKLNGLQAGQAFYRFNQPNGEQLLSSNFGQTFKTAEEALAAMKETPNDIYESVVPNGIDFSVTEQDGLLTARFNQELDLESMEGEEAMQLIEGILLTAASFDQQVKFDQILQKDWRDFDFSAPIPKPVGANPKNLILK